MNRIFPLALALFLHSFLSHATVKNKIVDPSLAQCVQQQLNTQQSTLITDVIKLKCHGMGISIIEGFASLFARS